MPIDLVTLNREPTVRRISFVLVLAAVPIAAPLAQLDSVVEPASKRAFPVRITVPGRDASHVLAGTGIRTKTFLKVQVYAYALYVDSAGARVTLAPWQGRTAEQLKDDPTLYDTLLRDNFGKSLRLHMTRDVGGDDMAEAFDDALEPRVDVAAEHGMEGGRDALATFRGYFDVEELTKESSLTFSWLPGGTLVSAVNGELRGEIQSPALCWALFDVYLGPQPIMKKGKETVVARLPEIL